MTFWWWHSITWFNDASSPIMLNILSFYDYAIFPVFGLGLLVAFLIGFVMVAPSSQLKIYTSSVLEWFWTVVPMFILIFLGYPSILLLYASSEVNRPLLTFKAVGHQWFWSYEYHDDGDLAFDSYILPSSDLSLGDLRSAEVDNRVVIPMFIDIRLLTTGVDVIHSWAVPGLGVNIDSVPGRLNGTSIYSDRPAIYYGQCSEICGTNHAFIPIVVESVPAEVFSDWTRKHSLTW